MISSSFHSTATHRTPLAVWSFLTTGISHRSLIKRLAVRELEARYRGSAFGGLWLMFTPLLMLAVYTFVFSVVFSAKWGNLNQGKGEFALFLFSGLIIFTLFSECFNRAPRLMLENVSYIKKVVFPIEIQAWVLLISALANATVSFLVLLLFYFVVFGAPPLTSLLFPILLIPLCFFTLGITWLLSSLGVFLRDLSVLTGVVTSILMFLCPIFYPISAVPESFRVYLYVNPLTYFLESAKQVLFFGEIPDPLTYVMALGIGTVVAWLGYLWFMKTKKGFADVI